MPFGEREALETVLAQINGVSDDVGAYVLGVITVEEDAFDIGRHGLEEVLSR